MAHSSRRFNFTHESLAKVVCPPTERPQKDSRVYVYDSKVPGLAFCVTETNAKSFYLCRMVAGRSKRMKLGLASDLSIGRARTMAGQYIGEIVTGKDPVQEKAKQRAEAAKVQTTLRDLWDVYRLEYLAENAKPRTIKEFARIYDAHLVTWGDLPLSEITSDECEALKTRVAARGHHMANRVLELVSAMFRRYGKRFGLPKHYTPTAGVEHFKEKPRDRVLAHEELASVFTSLDGEENETARDAFRMLIYTGARKSNVITMEYEHIRDEGGVRVWTVPAETMKNGDPLKVTLVPEAVEIIDRRIKANTGGSRYVFPAHRPTQQQVAEARKLKAQGKATREIAIVLRLSQTSIVRMVNPNYVVKLDAPFGGSAKAWERILERAKVKGARIHDLRRTYCTNLIEAGVPVPIVAAVLGHKTIATTERSYMHVRQKTAASAAVEGFAKVMEKVKAAQLLS
jgi:integrase